MKTYKKKGNSLLPIYYTKEKMICDICKKKCNNMIEYTDQAKEKSFIACYCGNRECSKELSKKLSEDWRKDDCVYIRVIKNEKKIKIKKG